MLLLAMRYEISSTFPGSTSALGSCRGVIVLCLSTRLSLFFLIRSFSDITTGIAAEAYGLNLGLRAVLLLYSILGLRDLMRHSRSLFSRILAAGPRSNPMMGTTGDIHPFLSINSPSRPFLRWNAMGFWCSRV